MANESKTACINPSLLKHPKGCGEPKCQDNQVSAGNPVNAESGYKVQAEVDYQSPTGLSFVRVYSSTVAYDTIPQSTPSPLLGVQTQVDASGQTSTVRVGIYDRPSPKPLLGRSVWQLNWDRSIQGVVAPPPSTPAPATGNLGISSTAGSVVYRLGMGGTAIMNNTITAAYVSRGGGKTYIFSRNGAGWVPDGDIKDRLVSSFDGAGNVTGWTYTTTAQEVEQYSATGKLSSVTDRNGNTLTLTYSDGTPNSPNGGYMIDATGVQASLHDIRGNPFPAILPAGLLIRITDAFGHSINLSYDVSARIAQMTDPAGGVYRYAYNDNIYDYSQIDNLVSVTYPDGKTKQYIYGEQYAGTPAPPQALTGILDENGDHYATWTYDAAGRATSSEHGATGSGIDRVTLTFNPDNTIITDALGAVRIQNFQTVQGIARNAGSSQPGGSGCGASSSALTYDINANIASRTDFNGNK
ncbi:MAG: hypothetical protein WAO71_01200, partial [Gallionella sp.]